MTTDTQLVEDMFRMQENLLQEYIADTDGNYETKNIKALLHELAEYEKGFAWKPWKNGIDAKLKDHLDEIPEGENPNRPLTNEEAKAYRKEEVVDMWHFAIQEAIETNTVTPEMITDFWDLQEQVHEPETLIRRMATVYNGDQLDAIFDGLVSLAKREFDNVEELHEWYGGKNKENHDRKDGESTGREEYKISDDAHQFDIDVNLHETVNDINDALSQDRYEVVLDDEYKPMAHMVDHKTGDSKPVILENIDEHEMNELADEFFANVDSKDFPPEA